MRKKRLLLPMLLLLATWWSAMVAAQFEFPTVGLVLPQGSVQVQINGRTSELNVTKFSCNSETPTFGEIDIGAKTITPRCLPPTASYAFTEVGRVPEVVKPMAIRGCIVLDVDHFNLSFANTTNIFGGRVSLDNDTFRILDFAQPREVGSFVEYGDPVEDKAFLEGAPFQGMRIRDKTGKIVTDSMRPLSNRYGTKQFGVIGTALALVALGEIHELSNRIDGIDTRIDGVDRQVQAQNGQIIRINDQLQGLSADFNQFRTNQVLVDRKQDMAIGRLDDITGVLQANDVNLQQQISIEQAQDAKNTREINSTASALAQLAKDTSDAVSTLQTNTLQNLDLLDTKFTAESTALRAGLIAEFERVYNITMGIHDQLIAMIQSQSMDIARVSHQIQSLSKSVSDIQTMDQQYALLIRGYWAAVDGLPAGMFPLVAQGGLRPSTLRPSQHRVQIGRTLMAQFVESRSTLGSPAPFVVSVHVKFYADASKSVSTFSPLLTVSHMVKGAIENGCIRPYVGVDSGGNLLNDTTATGNDTCDFWIEATRFSCPARFSNFTWHTANSSISDRNAQTGDISQSYCTSLSSIATESFVFRSFETYLPFYNSSIACHAVWNSTLPIQVVLPTGTSGRHPNIAYIDQDRAQCVGSLAYLNSDPDHSVFAHQFAEYRFALSAFRREVAKVKLITRGALPRGVPFEFQPYTIEIVIRNPTTGEVTYQAGGMPLQCVYAYPLSVSPETEPIYRADPDGGGRFLKADIVFDTMVDNANYVTHYDVNDIKGVVPFTFPEASLLPHFFYFAGDFFAEGAKYIYDAPSRLFAPAFEKNLRNLNTLPLMMNPGVTTTWMYETFERYSGYGWTPSSTSMSIHASKMPLAYDAGGYPYCDVTGGHRYHNATGYNWTRRSAQPVQGDICDAMRHFKVSVVHQDGQDKLHMEAVYWSMEATVLAPTGRYVQKIDSICPVITTAWRGSVLELILANTETVSVNVVVRLNTTNPVYADCISSTPYSLPPHPAVRVVNIENCGDVTITVNRFDFTSQFVLTPCGTPITQDTIDAAVAGYQGIPVDVQEVVETADSIVQQSVYQTARDSLQTALHAATAAAIMSNQVNKYAALIAQYTNALNASFAQAVAGNNFTFAPPFKDNILNLTLTIAMSANNSAAEYSAELDEIRELKANFTEDGVLIAQFRDSVTQFIGDSENATDRIANIAYVADIVGTIPKYNGTPGDSNWKPFWGGYLWDSLGDDVVGAGKWIANAGGSIWNEIKKLPDVFRDLLKGLLEGTLMLLWIILIAFGVAIGVACAVVFIKECYDKRKAEAANGTGRKMGSPPVTVINNAGGGTGAVPMRKKATRSKSVPRGKGKESEPPKGKSRKSGGEDSASENTSLLVDNRRRI